MKITKEQFFKRQTTLVEIGNKGQALLQKARVLVIGCGGLGSPVAVYLASSGVGHLHVVDFDKVSVSNLHRQVFYEIEDVGKYKAEVLTKYIQKRAPFTSITCTTEAVSKNTILSLISNFDIVVDGTDSLPIKYLINDACVLKRKPLVYGSLYKFDGYVATFNVLLSNGKYSANLRDAFPKIATNVLNCEEAGTLNPIVGMIALKQVNEVVKLITKTGTVLINQLHIYNSLRNSKFELKLKPSYTLEKIKKIFDSQHYHSSSCDVQREDLLISANELKQHMSEYHIINVINTSGVLPFKAHHNYSYNTFNVEDCKLDASKKYVVVCNKGITSYTITEKLVEKYPHISIQSLQGGIEDFK